MTDRGTENRSMQGKFVIAILGGAATVLGLLVLIGWHTSNQSLIQIAPSFVPMQYNTALGFLFAGAGLMLYAFGLRVPGAALGSLTLIVGSLTLSQYIFQIDLGIDELFFEHYITVQTSHPGRMAPNTAFSFTLVGLILILKLFGYLPWMRYVTGALGAVVVALATVALSGYLGNLEAAYGWGRLTRMAVHTSIGFIILGFGVTLSVWFSYAREKPGQSQWASILIGVGSLTLFVLFTQALEERESSLIHDRIQSKAESLSNEIQMSLLFHSTAFLRIGKRWAAQDGMTQEEWEKLAIEYSEDYAGVRAVEWIDPQYQVQWSISSMGTSISDEIQTSLGNLHQRSLDSLNAVDTVLISLPIELREDEMGFVLGVPLKSGDRFDGWLAAVFGVSSTLGAAVERELKDDFSTRLRWGNEAGYSRVVGAQSDGLGYVESIEFQLLGTTWQLDLWPTRTTLSNNRSPLTTMLLGLGILFSISLVLLTQLRQKAILETGRAKEINVHLEEQIAERERAELLLQERADELKRSNGELEQFAYVASHDLQEPLRMVASYLELLKKRYDDKLDEKGQQYIHYAVDGAHRMKNLINDLLVYSRVTSRAAPFVEIDVGKILANAISNLTSAIDDSGAKITYGKLPCLYGDSTQLMMVFQNLISNGIKFAPERTPEIEIEAEKTQHEWRFSIKDNGIGIDSQFHDRIFEIFERLHGVSQFAGTGIGLAVCRKIIHRHGGKIWIESQPDQGTTVFFTIPFRGVNHGQSSRQTD